MISACQMRANCFSQHILNFPSRKEAPYIREWIEYHRMLGFDKILVHNYDSTDDTKCILDAYAKEGIVVRVPEDIELGDTFKPVQRRALSYCAKYLSMQEENADAPTQTWMITHDIDEFLWFNQTDGTRSLEDAVNRLIRENASTEESLRVPRLFSGRLERAIMNLSSSLTASHIALTTTPALKMLLPRIAVDSLTSRTPARTVKRINNIPMTTSRLCPWYHLLLWNASSPLTQSRVKLETWAVSILTFIFERFEWFGH